jgi:hypothetical protein
MEYTIRRVAPGTVFKVAFVLYAIIGLVLAFLYGFFFLIFSSLGPGVFGPGMREIMRFGGGVGVVAVFLFAIVLAFAYAAFAAAMITVGVLIYNLLAAWVGGIKVILDPPAGWAAPPTIPYYVPGLPPHPPGPYPPAVPPRPPEVPPRPPEVPPPSPPPPEPPPVPPY